MECAIHALLHKVSSLCCAGQSRVSLSLLDWMPYVKPSKKVKIRPNQVSNLGPVDCRSRALATNQPVLLQQVLCFYAFKY